MDIISKRIIFELYEDIFNIEYQHLPYKRQCHPFWISHKVTSYAYTAILAKVATKMNHTSGKAAPYLPNAKPKTSFAEAGLECWIRWIQLAKAKPSTIKKSTAAVAAKNCQISGVEPLISVTFMPYIPLMTVTGTNLTQP